MPVAEVPVAEIKRARNGWCVWLEPRHEGLIPAEPFVFTEWSALCEFIRGHLALPSGDALLAEYERRR